MSISRLAGGSVPRWWCTPSRTWAGGAATLQPRHLLVPLCPLDVSHTFPHRDREKRELRKALTLALNYWASDAFARLPMWLYPASEKALWLPRQPTESPRAPAQIVPVAFGWPLCPIRLRQRDSMGPLVNLLRFFVASLKRGWDTE